MTMRDLHDYVAPERAPTHVSYHGARRLQHGPAVERRLDRRRGAQHPRGLQPRRRCRATQALHYYLEASRYSYADRNAYLADPDYVTCRSRASCRRTTRRRGARSSRRRPRRAPSARATRGPTTAAAGRRRSRSRPRRASPDRRRTCRSSTATATPCRTRSRSSRSAAPGWSCPASGSSLNNELTDFNYDSTGTAEPGRGRQAAAQLDEPDDRPQGRQAVPRARLTRRRDDHHDRPADARQPARLRDDAAATRSRRRAPASGTRARRKRSRRSSTRWGTALSARGHTFSSTPEIGAATGIEFLGGGKVVAAAEPVRRGGGSALVESPSP